MGNKQTHEKHANSQQYNQQQQQQQHHYHHHRQRHEKKPGHRTSTSSQELPSSSSFGNVIHQSSSAGQELTCIANRRVSDYAGISRTEADAATAAAAQKQDTVAATQSHLAKLAEPSSDRLPKMTILAAPDEDVEDDYCRYQPSVPTNATPAANGDDVQRSPSTQSVPSLILKDADHQEIDVSDTESILRETNGAVPKINITKSATMITHGPRKNASSQLKTPIQLSNLEISLVRRAWTQARHRGYNEPGSSIMKEVFAQNPDIKELFRGTKQHGATLTTAGLGITRTPSLRKKSDEMLNAMQLMEQRLHEGSPLQPEFRFAAHAEKLTQEMDAVVENLENLAAVEKRLIDSGRRHFEFAGEKGFKQNHWDLFARCMAERSLVWGGAFHQRRNSKTTEAWVKVCLFVVNSTKRGYILEARKARMRRRSADVARVDANTNSLSVDQPSGPDGARSRSGSVY